MGKVKDEDHAYALFEIVCLDSGYPELSLLLDEAQDPSFYCSHCGAERDHLYRNRVIPDHEIHLLGTFTLKEVRQWLTERAEAQARKMVEAERPTLYMCINCKDEFEGLPIMEKNECTYGYYHQLIKKSDLIVRGGE